MHWKLILGPTLEYLQYPRECQDCLKTFVNMIHARNYASNEQHFAYKINVPEYAASVPIPEDSRIRFSLFLYFLNGESEKKH